MDQQPDRKEGRNLERGLRDESRAGLSRPNRYRLKRWLGWPMCIGGMVLFIVGYVSSLAGVRALPFDPHHVVSVGGGLVLSLVGLVWATR